MKAYSQLLVKMTKSPKLKVKNEKISKNESKGKRLIDRTTFTWSKDVSANKQSGELSACGSNITNLLILFHKF